MKTNTATAIDYKASVETATAELVGARSSHLSTQNRVMYAEMDVAAIELQLADAKRKLREARKDERAAAKAWTEADHRLKVAETELLMKQPTLTKIDEWANQLKADWKASGTELTFTREAVIELRLTALELTDYHTHLQKATSLNLKRPKFNGYTTKQLAKEIIMMLEQTETDLVYSCPVTFKNDDFDNIDCGF